jgi:flagellar biosynthesis component FlhA
VPHALSAPLTHLAGDQYLSTLEVTYAKRWQYVSYVFAFILFNWAMVVSFPLLSRHKVNVCKFILTWAFRTQENPFKKFTASRKAQKTNKAQNEKSKEADGKASEKKQ